MRDLISRLRAAWWVASGAKRTVVYRALIRGSVEADPPAYIGYSASESGEAES